MPKTHEDVKREVHAYRERARALFDRPPLVSIPLHANVQLCEGGAFVEATVWVPSASLPPSSSS